MKRKDYWTVWRLLARAILIGLWLPTAGAFGVEDSGNAAPGTRELTNGITLGKAICLALESNPELRAYGARVEAAAGRASQAKVWSNPELELSAEDWPVSSGFSNAKQTFGIAQTLPYPGKKLLDKRIGGMGVKFSRAELAVRRAEILRDVKTWFYRVLASERLVEVSRELVTVAEWSASTARKRADAGAAADQEVLRAEVQWEQARTELRDFERDLAMARQGFVTVIGRPEHIASRLYGTLAEAHDPTLAMKGADEMLAQHPAGVSAQANVDRAELELRRARLEPYPDVRTSVSGGRIGETDQSIVQLGFTVPLPILDTSKGKKQEARANVRIAEAERERVRQQLFREWTNAQERYRAAAEQVTRYRESILPKAHEALRLVRAGFEEGKFGFIELLDTQRTTAEVQLAYQQKVLDLNLAAAEVEAFLPNAWSETGLKP